MKGGNQPNTVVIYVFNAGRGFFSTFWTLIIAYLYAKENKFPFFIEHTNWQYRYKEGWHDYFKSLEVYNGQYPNSTIKRYSSPEDLKDIPPRPLKAYIDITHEIYKLKDELLNEIDKKVKEYGTYKSLYIRRGDKINEYPLPSIADILQKTTIKDDGSNVFLQTDDFKCIDELQKLLPSCKILSITLPSQQGSTNNNMVNWTPEQRKEDTENLLVSIGIFVKGIECWTYYFSNVGQFHKFYSWDNVKLYNDTINTMEVVNTWYNKERMSIIPFSINNAPF